MLSGLTVSRVATVATLLTLIPAVAGCSGGSGGGSGGTGLEAALSRIADTAGNRTAIYYDDTAELVRLAGASPLAVKGFAQLRGSGAPLIVGGAYVDPSKAGLNIYGEDYAVTAGNPPKILTLLAGGQNSSKVTSTLTKLGWKNSGGKLVAPKAAAGSNTGEYAQALPQVESSGSDVLVGGKSADLSQIGAPSGPTLASDPAISSLASCLGTVVAAEIYSGYPGGRKPAALSAGIRQPASNTATPHAIVCVAWQTQAAAAQYAADLHKALSSGTSGTSGRPFSAELRNASVTVVGGSQHVVEWQADVPGFPFTVLGMAEEVDLPALPYCTAGSHATGCP